MNPDYNQEVLTDFILLVLNYSPYSRDKTPPAFIELQLNKLSTEVWSTAIKRCEDAGLLFRDADTGTYRLTDTGVALFTVEYTL